MTQPLICHFLIGLPASGKSTFARKLQQIIPDAAIVSTDTARKELYGKEEIQGNWNEVESQVLEQIKNAITSNKPVIYDATNVRRDWRMGMLMKIEEKLKGIDAPQVYWVAWHLQTPVDVCKEWNQDPERDRRVPDEVIEEHNKFLTKNQPEGKEGFFEIYSVSESYVIKTSIKKEPEEYPFEEFELKKITRRISGSKNRIKKYIFHKYSQILDFERLMNLVSLFVNYPGIGNLSVTSPNIIQQILGRISEFETEVDEISAVMSALKGNLYSDKLKLKSDLDWLEANLINIDSEDLDKPLTNVISDRNCDYYVGKTHLHSNLDAFSRLIKLIRYLVHGDTFPIPVFALNYVKQRLSLENIEEVQEIKERLQKRLSDLKSPILMTLVVSMIDEKILEIKPNSDSDKEPKTERGIFIDNVIRYYTNIKDIDFRKILNPYQIFPENSMKKGYYLGTSFLSKNDLELIFKEFIEPQAKHIQDPGTLAIYENLQRRIKDSGLINIDDIYPVRRIGTHSIIDPHELPENSLMSYKQKEFYIGTQEEELRDETNKAFDTKIRQVEKAIEQGRLLTFKRRKGVGTYDGDLYEFEAYPLQIVFHNIAWYLGYEQVGGKTDGIFRFERLDRLSFSLQGYKLRNKNEQKSRKEQIKALKKLTKLYRSSAGIFLGKEIEHLEQQRNFFENINDAKETVELLFKESVFSFIAEGTNRFPGNKVTMSLPPNLEIEAEEKFLKTGIFKKTLKSNDKNFPYIFKVDMPKWSLRDFDLFRWILGFGKEVKVTKPDGLRQDIKRLSKETLLSHVSEEQANIIASILESDR